MNKGNRLANAALADEYSLRRLNEWLQYEKYSWFLGAGIIWVPYSLIITGLWVIAVLFTPFLLWNLFKAGWYKSIVLYFAIVILPFVVVQLLRVENSVVDLMLSILPLCSFYIYSWILSYLVGEYLSERQELRRIKYDRKIAEKRLY